jgi:hypothetical protein
MQQPRNRAQVSKPAEPVLRGTKEELINGIKTVTEIYSIMVDEVKVSEYQKKDELQAQLRQKRVITKTYPSTKVTNSLQTATIFDIEAFGFDEEDHTNEEFRMAWVPVPAGKTAKDVQAMLDKMTEAGIYKILSNKPILTDEQQYSITQGQKTMDDYATTQAARYPDNHDLYPGQLILKDGRVQYRATFFTDVPKDDIDYRGKVEEYRTADIEAELTGSNAIPAQNVVHS